jgi:hypothetical protein
MPTLSPSAGTVAYGSRGSGDPVVLLLSGGRDRHDYDEGRALLPAGSAASASTGRAMAGPASTSPSTELRHAEISGHLPHTTSPALSPPSSQRSLAPRPAAAAR